MGLAAVKLEDNSCAELFGLIPRLRALFLALGELGSICLNNIEIFYLIALASALLAAERSQSFRTVALYTPRPRVKKIPVGR